MFEMLANGKHLFVHSFMLVLFFGQCSLKKKAAKNISKGSGGTPEYFC